MRGAVGRFLGRVVEEAEGWSLRLWDGGGRLGPGGTKQWSAGRGWGGLSWGRGLRSVGSRGRVSVATPGLSKALRRGPSGACAPHGAGASQLPPGAVDSTS